MLTPRTFTRPIAAGTLTTGGTLPVVSLVGWAWLLAGLPACGPSAESSDLPKRPQDLTADDAPADVKAAQAAWDALAQALGIGNNQAASTAELKAQLATPSSLLDAARAADYAQLLGRLTRDYAATAYASRCATIDTVVSLGNAKLVDADTGDTSDFAAAGLYLMRYKLQADASGGVEATTRSGLLVIPSTGESNSVVAAYAHGGDAGLGYGELAAGFGQLQANHVIVAPSFPGEPVCKAAADPTTRSCDEAGELTPATGSGAAYDSDADELLGMHDCIVRAAIGKLDQTITTVAGANSGIKLAALLNTRLARHGAGTLADLPASILVGASRGGLAAQLALAKTGAAMSVLASAGTGTTPLGTGYAQPAYFSCAAVVASPASFAFGEFRLGLEQWVKGHLAATTFAYLPGVRSLLDAFADYRSGAIDVGSAALIVARRDAALASPLIIAALRNWKHFQLGASNGQAGAWLSLHGALDAVVPISQAKLGYNVLLAAAANAAIVSPTDISKAPGLSLAQRSFIPNQRYLDGDKLAAGYLQHGDEAFFDSTAIVAPDFLSAGVINAPLPLSSAETAATTLAAQVFGASPTTAQLAVARAYVLSGVLRADVKPTPQPVGDAITLVDEGLTPAGAIGAWRLGACAKALE